MQAVIPDVHEVREDLTDFLGEAQAVGVLLEDLQSFGKLDRSLMVVSGDYGMPLFTHGKTTLHDFGTQVPLIMCHPTQVAAKRVVSEPVSLIDLAPTVMEFARLKPLADFNGQSLVPFPMPGVRPKDFVPRNWVLHGRELHFPTARAGSLPHRWRALRTPEFLYIVNFQPDHVRMGGPRRLDHDAMADQKTLEFDYADLNIGHSRPELCSTAGIPSMQSMLSGRLISGQRPSFTGSPTIQTK